MIGGALGADSAAACWQRRRRPAFTATKTITRDHLEQRPGRRRRHAQRSRCRSAPRPTCATARRCGSAGPARIRRAASWPTRTPATPSRRSTRWCCWSAGASTRPRSRPNSSSSQQTCWTSTAGERFEQSYNTAFPPWRIDRYADAGSTHGARRRSPTKRPAACFAPAPDEYWVPFVAADGTTYAGGTGGCAGMAPEAANVGGLSLPSNETYGVTELNGSGQADFDVWTAEDNASLGCSDTVACSLVAVPVMGISCDAGRSSPARRRTSPARTRPRCRRRLPRHRATSRQGRSCSRPDGEDVSVSGALWWAASNWRNRITRAAQVRALVQRLRRGRPAAAGSTSTAPRCSPRPRRSGLRRSA